VQTKGQRIEIFMEITTNPEEIFIKIFQIEKNFLLADTGLTSKLPSSINLMLFGCIVSNS
jgi:hypothetical protein